jgi:hypothetical protein
MKTKTLLLLFLFIGFATTNAFTQEWTKAQKEVWQVVEDSWMKFKTGDVEGSTAYLHEKYQGWSKNSPLPIMKDGVKKWLSEYKNRMQIEYYELNPARIVVIENAAVVDYTFYYELIYTHGDKKEQQEWYGKNAEFYVKEGGKWLLLGDLTITDKVPEDQ